MKRHLPLFRMLIIGIIKQLVIMALMCGALYGAAQEGRFLFRDIKLSEEFNGLIINILKKIMPDSSGL